MVVPSNGTAKALTAISKTKIGKLGEENNKSPNSRFSDNLKQTTTSCAQDSPKPHATLKQLVPWSPQLSLPSDCVRGSLLPVTNKEKGGKWQPLQQQKSEKQCCMERRRRSRKIK
jgi:hypothetical protein